MLAIFCGPGGLLVLRGAWGLTKVFYWLYISIIPSFTTLASLVWWPGCHTASTTKRQNRIQRLACLGISEAMRTTPTSAMEVLTCRPPLYLAVQGKAKSDVDRPWSLGCSPYLHPNRGHSPILMWLQKLYPIFSMGNNILRPAYKFDPQYKVTMLTTEEWTKVPGSPPVVKGLVWYTDGSRKSRGAEAGVYGQSLRSKLSISLRRYATIFQAEVLVIFACIYEIQSNGGSEKYINICLIVKQLWKLFRLLKQHLHWYGSAKGRWVISPPITLWGCFGFPFILEYVEMKLSISSQARLLFTNLLDRIRPWGSQGRT
jgi:hypothetical protein